MDEDDDNDERNDDNDEDQDTSMKSYSKKKFFGKVNKDLKMINVRTTYKPRAESLRGFKMTMESGMAKISDLVCENIKCKLDHKIDFMEVNSKTKFNLNMKRNFTIQGYDLNSTLKKNWGNTTITWKNKVNNKKEISSKAGHSLNLGQQYRLKYELMADKKKDVTVYGANLGLTFKRSFNDGLSWLSLIKNYSQVLNLNTVLKTNNQRLIQFIYKGHLITTESHRLYLQHKISYETAKPIPVTNVVSLNCQDSLAIGTFNLALTFEDKTLKTKQARIVMEFDKKYRFGVQKRNDAYEAMFQRYKLKYNALKSIKLYVGNNGFLSTCQGKLNIWKNWMDYAFSFKVKPQRRNFYEDCSFGLNLKWNI